MVGKGSSAVRAPARRSRPGRSWWRGNRRRTASPGTWGPLRRARKATKDKVRFNLRKSGSALVAEVVTWSFMVGPQISNG